MTYTESPIVPEIAGSVQHRNATKPSEQSKKMDRTPYSPDISFYERFSVLVSDLHITI